MPTKTPEKKTSGGKANALQKPLQPSEENRREILADDKLQKVFGKDKVTMFEMNKHLAQHLK